MIKSLQAKLIKKFDNRTIHTKRIRRNQESQKEGSLSEAQLLSTCKQTTLLIDELKDEMAN